MYNAPTLEEAWNDILNDNGNTDMEEQIIKVIELSFNKSMLTTMEPQETAMTLAGKMIAEYGECQDRARQILREELIELGKIKEPPKDGMLDGIEELLMRVETDIASVIASTTFKLSEVSTEMQEKTNILIRKPEAYSFVANTYEYVTNHLLDFKKEMQDMLVSFGSDVTDESFNSKIQAFIQNEIKIRENK